MNINEQDVQIDAQIDALADNQFIPNDDREERIQQLRSSRLVGTDSSPKTVFSLANTMIGSAIIIYPVLFVEDGIVGSTIIMLVVGCIQYLTCRLLVIHNRPDEPSFNESILRIGGMRLSKFNSLVNMLLLFFVCIAYFLLVATNFYQVAGAVLHFIRPSYVPPKTNQIQFNVFSMQWACIICAFFTAPILLKQDINAILKLTKYAIYCVGVYIVFILSLLIRNITEGSIHFNEYIKFDPNFSNVAGAFALSFLIHPTAAPILKKSINLKNNQRDLLFGYILTGFIYFYVGFIGGLACAPEVPNINKHPEEYSTIFDCIPDSNVAEERGFYIFGKVVQILILFQNLSVLPILVFLTRKEAITLINKPHLNSRIFPIFTFFFILVAALTGILTIDVSIVLSFTGAVIGFFMGYGIPIYVHLKCYHHRFTLEEDLRRRSVIESEIEEELGGMEVDEETVREALRCNEHPQKSKAMHYTVYGFLIVVGIMLGVFKVYSFFG